MISGTRQLNPFEIKAEVLNLISKFSDIEKFGSYEVNFKTLDAQSDKKTITKILFKELSNVQSEDTAKIICFLLERYSDKEELISHLWSIIKSNMVSNIAKISALNFLRLIDTNWNYEEAGAYFADENELIDADTKRLLNDAITNPEVQIDFLDFLNSLSSNDKIMLVNSLGDDYKEDALANILVPVFLSQPDSEIGKTALELLGNSRSQLAYHALNSALPFVDKNLEPLVRKNLSILKLAGIRQDNTHEYYKEILSSSKPYRFCVTFPDGHGNQALIVSRIRPNEKIQFVAIVADDYRGIRDCFGFNEISKFECDKIIERFYRDETPLNISPEALKTVLLYAEKLSKTKANNWLMPYEYICWKNLLADFDVQSYDIKEILDGEFKSNPLNDNDFITILNFEFLNHWFLNAEYGDEFEEFIKTLNDALYTNPDADIDILVEENINKIFYLEEKHVWHERILMCSYLMLAADRKNDAGLLYNLYYDQSYLKEFFKNIIRKSIYEYYVGLKFNIAENSGRFNVEQLENIVKTIENRWVHNA